MAKPAKKKGVAPVGSAKPPKKKAAAPARNAKQTKSARRAGMEAAPEPAAPVQEKPRKSPKPAPAPKSVKRVEERLLAPFEPSAEGATADVLDRLWTVIEQRRVSGDAVTSHSARLLARGTSKVAQKLGEEAVELVIEAMTGDRDAIIAESADVLYHLLVLWVDAQVRPEEAWAELRRREGISGIAEKAARPKAIIRLARTTKLP